MTPHEEAKAIVKMERKLNGQRETPSGRSFLWNTQRFMNCGSAKQKFNDNFDQIRFDKDPPGKGI